MKDKKSGKQATEKITADLTNLMQEQRFKTQAELRKFMETMMKSESVPYGTHKDAANLAQDLIYDAWENNRKSERIRLAKKALSISPDCADAYNLLAQEAAKSLPEARELYQKGIDAGRRALGEKIFKEDGAHFWGMIETRPYMRSLAGMMQCLWDEGKHDEAINQAKEILKLNRNDNQGIRYVLIAYLANIERYDELDKFMNKGDYKDDFVAEWLYTRTLLSFVKNGASKKAEKELAIALQRNIHVLKYLTGRKPIPRILPDNITIGGEDEAFCYAAANIETWKKVQGAINWLKESAAIKIVSKVGRA